MKIVHGFFAALMMLAFAALPLPAKADTEAQKFLESIYRRYIGPDTPGVPLDTKEALLSYFTPELAAMIAADGARAEKENEPPTLDGDPFVFAQDWDIKDVAVKVKDTSPGKAVGIATFTNFGETQMVELDLVKLPGGWRIDDIHWPDGTLRDLYKNGMPEKESPPDTRKL
jgi:uncharacterized protein DUF3828